MYKKNTYNTVINECKKATANVDKGQRPYKLTKSRERMIARLVKYYVKANR